MKTAFVLSGGGAAGSYQCGALEALHSSGIRPDFITANSAGSLNAAGYSCVGIQDLKKLWGSINKRQDVFGDKFLGYIGALFGAESVWNSKPLEKLINSVMSGKTPTIPFYTNCVDLKTGDLITHFHTGNTVHPPSVLASASLPILTQPVYGRYVDGGVRENTPLRKAIDEGADRIFVFLNSPAGGGLAPKEEFKGLKSIAERTLEIMSDEIFWNDIATCEFYNEQGIGRKIELHWIAPTERKVGTLDFNQKAIQGGLKQGYEDGMKLVESLKEKGLFNAVP